MRLLNGLRALTSQAANMMRSSYHGLTLPRKIKQSQALSCSPKCTIRSASGSHLSCRRSLALRLKRELALLAHSGSTSRVIAFRKHMSRLSVTRQRPATSSRFPWVPTVQSSRAADSASMQTPSCCGYSVRTACSSTRSWQS